jgi:hypothetical protein
VDTPERLLWISQTVQDVRRTIQTELDAIFLKAVQKINRLLITGQGHILPYYSPVGRFNGSLLDGNTDLYYHNSGILKMENMLRKG